MYKHILFILLLALSVSAHAQHDHHQTDSLHTHTHEHSDCVEDSLNPMKEAILSEVTVQGVTGTQRLRDAAAPFMVVSPKQLHNAFGTNIVDAISHLPGLSQINTGAGISKPVIRGLGYNRVVVVDQGIRQEGQQWGDEHGLEVDAEGVHSVEVLKGPASLMYGSDAIAGVMILHPEHALEEGTMQVKVGGEYQSNNGLYDYHAGFAGNIGGWFWNWHYLDKAAHSYKNARDGYIPGSWFRERDVTGVFGVNKTWGHSWLRFSHVNFTPGITEGERDADTGQLLWEDGNSAKAYSQQLPYQRVLHTKVVSDNSWYFGNGTLKAIVGYQQNFRREYEADDEVVTAATSIEPSLAMRLQTVNYDVKYLHTLPYDWKIATGIGGMWQQNRNEADEQLIPGYHLFDFGIFATASKQLQQWHLSGGVRMDNRHLTLDQEDDAEQQGVTTTATQQTTNGTASKWQEGGNFTGVTGSIGAVWNVSDRLNLRLNAARGFRAPTVSELAADGVHEGSLQYELGNADLKPEKSTQVDLGMDYTSHFVSLTASLFANWITDYIFLARLPYETDGYRTYQYRQGDARLMGGELSADVHPIDPLHIQNTFSFVRGIQLHQPSESRNLPMMPAPRWIFSMRYELPDLLRGHLRRTHIAATMEYNLRQDNYYAVDDAETATPDYGIVNLSAATDIHIFGHNCIELTVSCQNLFDKVYQSHLSRLKYADVNTVTGREGIAAMGRNICVKVNIPIDIHLR